jgi:hypothetical protein
MDEIAPEYDVVVLGTGMLLLPRQLPNPNWPLFQVWPSVCCLGMIIELPEFKVIHYSLLSYFYSVLSVKGNKVLHIDRNDHYGG